VRPDGLLTWRRLDPGRRHPDTPGVRPASFAMRFTLARIARPSIRPPHTERPCRLDPPGRPLIAADGDHQRGAVRRQIHELGRFTWSASASGPGLDRGAPCQAWCPVRNAYTPKSWTPMKRCRSGADAAPCHRALGGAVTHPERPKKGEDGARLVSDLLPPCRSGAVVHLR
jgi:hypothetical protein